jgi:putative ABC transport system permease protein
MIMFRLIGKSILNRRGTVALTVLSIALSVALLLGVERLRAGTREAFAGTVSGTDLVVGARTGTIPLLLYSVFRIGNPTNNVSWKSYQDLAKLPQVAWTIPLSLGDSHRGFRVLGTSPAYFENYHYGKNRSLEFAHGQAFVDVYDAVLGADVARELRYSLGSDIVVAHGMGKLSLMDHGDKPFRVVGILRKTGTPVDRTVHVSLAGIEAIHADWFAGMPVPGAKLNADQARKQDLTPKSITAFMVGLRSKTAIFHVQRYINEYRQEALVAALPGVTLYELWDVLSVPERVLLAISALVACVGLAGMATALLAGLNERRREMAVLRSVGAQPRHVFFLLAGEAGLLTLIGAALGVGLLYGSLLILQPFIESNFGLFLPIGLPSLYEAGMLGAIVGGGFLLGALPAYRAYRMSVADGITVRV